MSCLGPNYNPSPTRTWTRTDGSPLMITKQEVLGYRKQGRITKKELYSQIAKGMWVNNKSYATQTETYTNNNVNGYQSVGYTKKDSITNLEVPVDTPVTQCFPATPSSASSIPITTASTASTSIPPPSTAPPPTSTSVPITLSVSSIVQNIIMESTLLNANVINNPCTGTILKTYNTALFRAYELSASGIKCSGTKKIIGLK